MVGESGLGVLVYVTSAQSPPPENRSPSPPLFQMRRGSRTIAELQTRTTSGYSGAGRLVMVQEWHSGGRYEWLYCRMGAQYVRQARRPGPRVTDRRSGASGAG